MSASSALLACMIVPVSSPRSAGFASCWSSEPLAMMACNGVRSSWLTLARKAVFASFAASAAIFARDRLLSSAPA